MKPNKPDLIRWITAGILFILSILSLIFPLWPGTELEKNLGSLLIWAGVIEIYDGFRRAERSSKNSAQLSGLLSLVMGTLLWNAGLFRLGALHVFVLGIFIIDMVRYAIRFFRSRQQKTSWFDLSAALANMVIAVLIIAYLRQDLTWVLSVAIFIRIAGIAVLTLAAKSGILKEVDVDVARSLGLLEDENVLQRASQVKRQEERAAFYDQGWIITFLLVLFFIHLGRMGMDRSFLGILSPLVATLGDAIIAIIITYLIIAPIRILMLKLMRKRSQRLWTWIHKVERSKRRIFSLRTLADHWLTRRIRAEIRLRKSGYSAIAAVRLGLKMGLPLSAMLVAIMPMLGMSWYFDTENWASGIWDQWAAQRADHWRMAMASAVGEKFDKNSFRLQPTGVDDANDFSFVVLGDPGEGDASQQVLKDQILKVMDHEDVRFLVISSDVVYPTGSLNDYERKFWLPMKGVTKPVYAIPGNHDWYDALDGFVATFYEPSAARQAMMARAGSDMNITATTKQLMDDMISKSEAWRKEYSVPTGFQNAPYFQISSKDFVFISIETGVVRQIDSLQMKWLKNVLNASRGKFVMALLGHPFYAIGEYQGKLNPQFDSLHSLLRRYRVPLVMAGDTHDLEYYQEPASGKNTSVTHHFVNGGGGAYLSIGAAMAEPASMPTKEYAFYPTRPQLENKIEALTRWYKYPAWWWTKKLDGWPFSAEWLSAMFDYNEAPFFQSFMEIKLQRSQNRIVLIPYSNHGRIRWTEMMSTTGSRPAGSSMDNYAEWIIPM